MSSIQQAVDEAENMAGCEISTVYAAISGAHVRGLNSHGIVAVKDKEVRDVDVARVIEQAKAVAIPMDREVLHVLPQQYVVDDQDGIRDPLGMAGVRLEAKVHIVTGSLSAIQNLQKCVESCGLHVDKLCLQHVASSDASQRSMQPCSQATQGRIRRAWPARAFAGRSGSAISARPMTTKSALPAASTRSASSGEL